MDLETHIRRTNRMMIGFDTILASGALFAPAATLRVLGHDRPSPDAERLFQRCAPIWFTFAAAHAVADRRGEPRDWWALAWLRGTELFTDALWAGSPAIPRRESKLALRLAGVGNLMLAGSSAYMARRS